MQKIDLQDWGLSSAVVRAAALEQAASEGLELARVTEQHRNLYRVVCEAGFFDATVAGRLAHAADGAASFPAVGDWVLVARDGGASVIHRVLPRGGVFLRKAAGRAQEAQVVAANIDMVFICMALNEDYNLRRLERYLAIAWDSGATPLVILTKADLCDDVAERANEASGVAPGVDILVCSSLQEDGCAQVQPYLVRGRTVAFIGSSGVGKSTLINRLAGEERFTTGGIREGGKGRHTTTHRQLIALASGAALIDTPGMRELGAVSVDTERSFADIEELALNCKFHDCSHQFEPGCAVRAAVEVGALAAARLENYRKLKTEAAYSGLSSRQIEDEKINRMFGGKKEMKQFMRKAGKKK